jgi:hypothetical protein
MSNLQDTMKYLYLVDYYAPTSHSDGGLLNVIAESDDECFDLVVEWDNETWTEYYPKLRENIIKAPKFALVDEEESRVVEAFTT